jgi:hypothetical protein
MLVAASALVWSTGASAQEAGLTDLYGNGVHAFFSGNNTLALQHLNEAIDAGTRDPRAFYFRGLIHLRENKIDEADADFASGADLETGDAAGLFNVDFSLQRIQGRTRMMIERHRLAARTALLRALAEERVQYRQQIDAARPEVTVPARPPRGRQPAPPSPEGLPLPDPATNRPANEDPLQDRPPAPAAPDAEAAPPARPAPPPDQTTADDQPDVTAPDVDVDVTPAERPQTVAVDPFAPTDPLALPGTSATAAPNEPGLRAPAQNDSLTEPPAEAAPSQPRAAPPAEKKAPPQVEENPFEAPARPAAPREDKQTSTTSGQSTRALGNVLKKSIANFFPSVPVNLGAANPLGGNAAAPADGNNPPPAQP